MPTARVCDDGTTLTADERFVELLCADEELLRAEFDAIIAAEWPSPVPAEPDRDADAERRRPRHRHCREAGSTTLPRRPRHPGVGGWSRQRSPPPTPATTENRKGR
jgi:hypothetical protein